MTLEKTARPAPTDEHYLESVIRDSHGNFAELKRRIKAQGLLEKQGGFLYYKMAINAVLFAISVWILFNTGSWWVLILNAAFLAFIFGQIGFVTHDMGHRQGFGRPRKNDFFGLIHGNLMLGMSYGWWVDKHNQHHANPNQVDFDPDIEIPVLAFTEEEALKKKGIIKTMVKYQGYLFVPILMFETFSLRVGSIQFLWNRKDWKYRKIETVLFILHFAWFFALIFYALGGWQAIAFIAIQQALFGLYLSSVFAPNHKGMPMIPDDVEMDFLQLQVVTARNVRSHPVTDFWYGGLNYQIEHHLFPTMARNQLREAQKIIRAYCEECNVPYYETSILRSYVEILTYLHEISAVLRTKPEARFAS
ncbi:MAG TPA: acyl-CoA desaturase [Anaerolineales bacterium]|nr:acyl-CoA desaturase [Anaerolineales bacterium]